VEKYGRDRQATDDNKERHIKDAICMRDKGRNVTDTQLTFNLLNAELISTAKETYSKNYK
jgi:hypothetical protein